MAAERRRAPPAWRRGRLATIRVRTTVAAVAVVGLALGLGSVVLVTVLRDTLTREVRAAARRAARTWPRCSPRTPPVGAHWRSTTPRS
jgi:hypothetical protein